MMFTAEGPPWLWTYRTISRCSWYPMVLMFLVIKCLATDAGNVTVQTPLGEVIGTRKTYPFGLGEHTDTIDSFLGLPYAKPPLGSLRFEAPEPVEPWQHPMDATVWSRGSCTAVEDCLYLNIYSPYKSSDDQGTRYPVMFYIHGGSYMQGTATDYDGTALAQYGVVVVIINYRLFLAGFLSTDNSTLPGNYGVLDQVIALNWVSNNIRHFRGNPKEVTIFGNSAGGSSVGIHIISPLSKGLFHRAIIQSGPINAYWASYKSGDGFSPRQFFTEVVEKQDCVSPTVQDAIACLKEVEYEHLIDPWTKNSEDYKFFTISEEDTKPRIDGVVIPESITSLLSRGRVNNVPVMLGVTSEESARIYGFFLDSRFYSYYPDADHELGDGMDRASFLKMTDYFAKLFDWPSTVSDVIKFHYTDWTNPNDTFVNRDNFIQLCGDTDMAYPTHSLANAFDQIGMPVYRYVFDYKLRHVAIFPEWVRNYSYHEIELSLVFGAPFTGHLQPFVLSSNFTREDKTMSKALMTWWTNFAKTGKPTRGSENPFNTDWVPYTKISGKYLSVEEGGISIRDHVKPNTFALWNWLMPRVSINVTASYDVAPTKHYQPSFPAVLWVFVAFSVALLCVVIVLGALVISYRNSSRRLLDPSYSMSYNGPSRLTT
ncbi:acetylcholinesterase-like [Lineus longissimus]|uniref:acetylcholinesterase-like n=1 Tax=Lineus longissimus TaxID=88925 RepID=UPI002B4C9864